jgi:hypothetical protein
LDPEHHRPNREQVEADIDLLYKTVWPDLMASITA